MASDNHSTANSALAGLLNQCAGRNHEICAGQAESNRVICACPCHAVVMVKHRVGMPDTPAFDLECDHTPAGLCPREGCRYDEDADRQAWACGCSRKLNCGRTSDYQPCGEHDPGRRRFPVRVPLVQQGGGEINGSGKDCPGISLDRLQELFSALTEDLEPAVRRDVKREMYAAYFRGKARSEHIRKHRRICAGCLGDGEHTVSCSIWQRSEQREALAS
jgi:hypothetical protein